jgi:rubrerythrin
LKEILEFQRKEITEYHVYRKLAKKVSGKNAEILLSIAEDEKRHYEMFRKITGKETKPSMLLVFWYILLATLFGLTFALKLMERNEKKAEKAYEKIDIPEVVRIMKDEERHEEEILNMLDEERLNYVSSMVLGLNDALVELTGALAGLTFAFQNTKIVGLSGLITGIAAAFSMAASEYLSQRAEPLCGSGFHTDRCHSCCPFFHFLCLRSQGKEVRQLLSGDVPSQFWCCRFLFPGWGDCPKDLWNRNMRSVRQ